MTGTNTGSGILASAAVAVLLAAACSSPLESDGGFESITIVPADASVSVGGDLPLNAEVRDAAGELVNGVRLTWSSEDASVATVSGSGVVTGVRVGTVLIAASARGKDAFARIAVSPSPVASVRLSTGNRSMFVGQTLQMTAEALDSRGDVLGGRTISWTTSNASVASVTNAGLVTALAPGGAIITAASEGKTASASITVSIVPVASVVLTPESSDMVVGQTTQLRAELRDASGGTLTGRLISWTTSNAQVATVSSQGLVTAVGSGNATITASAEGRSATASVSVSPRPASAVIVSPNQVTILAGQTVQLAALVTDDRGQVLSGKPVTYSSSNTQVATVSGQGVVTGIATGSATITARSEGASGTATVIIAPDPVAAVEITPPSATVIVGQTTSLTAIAKNVTGQVLSGRPILWSSSTPALASVSSSGVVTGLAAGNAVIVATIEGKQASATVTVRPVPVASVTVTPATSTLTVGQSATLTATTLDASGNTLSGRVVGWSSSDNAVATVSSGGVVTAVGSGSATITASSEGQSGTATVTVGAVPVANVVVTPGQTSVVAGQTVTLTATARDAGGNTLGGRPVAWSSSSTSVATVSSTGVVTGVSPGSATITATSEGKSGTASITVTAPVPATVTVSPATATVPIGATTQLTASVRDANGGVIANSQVTWSSSNTSVATVSSAGVVSAVAAGSATITATSGPASGTATITVPAPAINSIVITPTNPRVKEGKTIQLTATAYDTNNQPIPGVTFTWTSSNTSRATVDSTGLVTGIRDGTLTITASAGGKSKSVSLRVDED